MILGMIMWGMGTPVYYAIMQRIIPAPIMATGIGIDNGLANFGAAMSPAVIGFLDRSHRFLRIRAALYYCVGNNRSRRGSSACNAKVLKGSLYFLTCDFGFLIFRTNRKWVFIHFVIPFVFPLRKSTL